MEKTFRILFFISKTSLLKNVEAPVCMRITIGCQIVEFHIKRGVKPDSCTQACGGCSEIDLRFSFGNLDRQIKRNAEEATTKMFPIVIHPQQGNLANTL